MLTPVKAIKSKDPIITQTEKAVRELFSTALFKVKQTTKCLSVGSIRKKIFKKQSKYDLNLDF